MSNVPRLYVTSDLAEAGFVALSKDQAHYLTRVMRLGKGANVRVFNGRDGDWLAEIDEVVSKSTVLLKARRQVRSQEVAPQLTLMFAPLKKTRTDFVIEKATELGVCRILPVMTEFTNTERVRTERLTALAIEAAEQTERLDLPEIAEPVALAAALDRHDEGQPLFFCDEASVGDPGDGPEVPTLTDALQGRDGQPATMLIGPEGGFSPVERQMLQGHDAAVRVSLGPRVLRAETAAVAALALWQALCGDWRKS